jgi:hypothetical protein
LEAWQLPAWGVKVTFQVPSKAPGLMTLARVAASAGVVTATAAAINIHCMARAYGNSAEATADKENMLIFFLL